MTKRVDGEDLTSDCFLIVGDDSDTSTWKLPFRFSDPERTANHLRNDLVRFGETKAPAELKRAAWPRLIALCRDFGIEPTDAMRARLARRQVADPTATTAQRFRRRVFDEGQLQQIREELTVR